MTLEQFTIAMVAEGFYVQPLSHGAVLFVRPLTGRVYYGGGDNIPCRLSPNGGRGDGAWTGFAHALDCAKRREV